VLGDGVRLVQLTPLGSGCSIVVGTVTPTGLALTATPGSTQGLQLVVPDVAAAQAELIGRGVEASDVQVCDRDGRLRPRRDGENLDNVGFVFFAEPDGNGWTVQQISSA